MEQADKDFAEVAALDRNQLIVEAAKSLDALASFAGPTEEPRMPTEESKLIRALADDEGRFAKTLTVYKISSEKFLARKLPVPLSMKDLFDRYRYYFLEFPFELDPAAGWGFNKLEVRIELNPDDKPEKELPRVFQIFPDPQFQQLFEANAKLEVGVNANCQFAAKVHDLDVKSEHAGFKLEAAAEAHGQGSAGFLIGPLSYSVKRAIINHRGTGKEWARWEISGTLLNKGDDPRLMIIVQVPKDCEHLKVRGQLLASRYLSLANYRLREVITHLSETLRRFFEGGAPYYYRPADDWDLTRQIELGK